MPKPLEQRVAPSTQPYIPAKQRPHLGLTDAAEQAINAAATRFQQKLRIAPSELAQNTALTPAAEQAINAARQHHQGRQLAQPGYCRPFGSSAPTAPHRAATRPIPQLAA